VFEFETPTSHVTIHNTDCIAGMRERLAAGSVDVMVTSPPYNLGIGYKSYDDSSPRADYLRWIGQWADAARDALADEGSLFLNVGGMPKDPWVPFEVLGVMRERFHLQNVIHWVKSIAISKADVGNYPGIEGDVAVGHYKPINSKRFVNDCHEYIFHLTKSGAAPLDRLAIGVPYQDKSNIARWAGTGRDRRCRGNTWFIPYKTILSRDKERPHPATFPIRLPEQCIRLHGLERAGLVVDPFLGIGHTALACLDLGVDFTGFEIDADYFAESCRAVRGRAGLFGQAARKEEP